jgi:hypothetical protein
MSLIVETDVSTVLAEIQHLAGDACITTRMNIAALLVLLARQSRNEAAALGKLALAMPSERPDLEAQIHNLKLENQSLQQRLADLL